MLRLSETSGGHEVLCFRIILIVLVFICVRGVQLSERVQQLEWRLEGSKPIAAIREFGLAAYSQFIIGRSPFGRRVGGDFL